MHHSAGVLPGLLGQLLDHSPWAVLLLDETARLVAANPAAERLWGVDMAEVGQPLASLVGEMLQLPALLASAPGTPIECFLPRRATWLVTTRQPLADGYVALYSQLAHSPATRSRLPLALEQPAGRAPRNISLQLQTAFDTLPLLLMLLEAVRNDEGMVVNFEFLHLNKAAKHWYEPAEIVGQHYLDLHPKAINDLFARYKEVAETGVPADFVYYDSTESVRRLPHWFRVLAQAEGDLLVLVFQDVTEQKYAQQAARTHQQQLIETVLTVEENTKRRIAENLHNGLAQVLYATQLNLAQQPLSPLAIQRAADLLEAAVGQTRTIAHELVPRALEHFGLEAAIRDICNNFNHPQLRMRCHLVSLPTILPPYLTLAIYRLVQELANNIIKHAQAPNATIRVLGRPSEIVLEAQDNGRGFQPNQPHKGLGLQALRDRVYLLGGQFTLHTAPGKGTHIIISLPLPT